MFKKIDYKSLSYKDLERYHSHDIKREKLKSFYETFDFIDLIENWPNIVGTSLSEVTSPLKIKNDSLIIVSKHSSYSQNISFLSEQIKNNIFILFPNLKNIIKKLNFITQEKFFSISKNMTIKKNQEHQLHPQSPKYKILKSEAEKVFSNVEDETLRDLFISIYIQSF
jgi:hypothetical protein